MADVHVYVNKPARKESTDLEGLAEALRKLEYVSEVELDLRVTSWPSHSMVGRQSRKR